MLLFPPRHHIITTLTSRRRHYYHYRCSQPDATTSSPVCRKQARVRSRRRSLARSLPVRPSRSSRRVPFRRTSVSRFHVRSALVAVIPLGRRLNVHCNRVPPIGRVQSDIGNVRLRLFTNNIFYPRISTGIVVDSSTAHRSNRDRYPFP